MNPPLATYLTGCLGKGEGILHRPQPLRCLVCGALQSNLWRISATHPASQPTNHLPSTTYGLCRHTAFATILSLATLVYGWLPFLWRTSGGVLHQLTGLDSSYEIAHSVAFMLLMTAFDTAVELPWAWYRAFVVEERHGFNKQTLGFFIKDMAKQLAVSLVLGCAIVAGLLFVIRLAGDNFVFYAWLFAFAVAVFMFTIYHDFIAPLFDKVWGRRVLSFYSSTLTHSPVSVPSSMPTPSLNACQSASCAPRLKR